MVHILIIEDNKDIREVTAEFLEIEGYQVTAAVDGEDGVKKASELLPDVIVCDIMMPKLNGYDTFLSLKENEATRLIPFIFLTAKTEKEDFRKAMNLGVDDYISKPFEIDELIGAIETRLKKNLFLKETYSKRIDNVSAFLENASEDIDIKAISSAKESKRLKDKEILYKEGADATHLYFILKGFIKTFVINEDGKEFVSGIYSQGDFVGHFSLLSKLGKYEATAMVMDNVEICSISKEDFKKLIYQNNAVSNQFVKMLSNDTIKLQEQLFDMAYTPVRKRAAKALLDLASKGAINTENDQGINIPREDFAGLIGTATETAIRTLKYFKDEKLIEILNGKRFVIINEDGLRNLADSEY